MPAQLQPAFCSARSPQRRVLPLPLHAAGGVLAFVASRLWNGIRTMQKAEGVFVAGSVPWVEVAQTHDAKNVQQEAVRGRFGVPDSTVRGEAGASGVESSTGHACGWGMCVVRSAQTVFAQNEDSRRVCCEGRPQVMKAMQALAILPGNSHCSNSDRTACNDRGIQGEMLRSRCLLVSLPIPGLSAHDPDTACSNLTSPGWQRGHFTALCGRKLCLWMQVRCG